MLDAVLLRRPVLVVVSVGIRKKCLFNARKPWVVSSIIAQRNTMPWVRDCGSASGSRNTEYNQLCQMRNPGSSSQVFEHINDISVSFNLLLFVILDDLTLGSPGACFKSILFIPHPKGCNFERPV